MVYLVIRIRGIVNIPSWAEKTLDNLNLRKKFNATIVSENSQTLGMLRKVKDIVAWKSVDESIIKELLQKRGRKKGAEVGSHEALDILLIMHGLKSAPLPEERRINIHAGTDPHKYLTKRNEPTDNKRAHITKTSHLEEEDFRTLPLAKNRKKGDDESPERRGAFLLDELV
jgi:ribosomal protein L30/L7E